jgi:hypothetical protein
MGSLVTLFQQAGIDNCDSLFDAMDTFGEAPLLQAGCQVGHIIKLQHWRNGREGSGKQTCGSVFQDWLAERGVDLLLPQLLQHGVDSLYVLQALSVEQLMDIGIGHEHIRNIEQESAPLNVVCSPLNPCQRTLCNSAARNKGKVCTHTDPQHYVRFCHCREAHPDKIFRKPRAGAARIPWHCKDTITMH